MNIQVITVYNYRLRFVVYPGDDDGHMNVVTHIIYTDLVFTWTQLVQGGGFDL